MIKNDLAEFKKYLINHKLVPEKNVSFYTLWIKKFLSFSNSNQGLSQEILIAKFLAYLQNQKNIADWQISQAKTAIELYLNEFSKNDSSALHSNSTENKQTDFELKPILNKMREAIRIKHYSYKTERTYLDWIKRFYNYLREVNQENTSFDKLDSSNVRDFLSYLAIKQRVSASTQNQAFNALLFLFRNILEINLHDLGKTVRAKRGMKLPIVLSIEETEQLFKYVTGKELLILQLLYGSGLRLMELARLRVKDIDFSANLIFVRSSKQDKDRSTMLPKCVKDTLQIHLQEVKLLHEKDFEEGYGEVYLPNALERKYPNANKEWSWQYVFPAPKLSIDPRSKKIRRHHISEKTIQNIVKKVTKKANLAKHITVHTLRHCFATHLLISGVNIRQIQELLGHKHVETTMIYTHVLRDMVNVPKSPVDSLMEMSCKV